MAKKDTEEKRSVSKSVAQKLADGEKLNVLEEKELYDEVSKHHEDAENFVSPNRKSWTEKEELLLGVVNDDLSKTAKSQVFDPQLATQAFERSSRVMWNDPRGKSTFLSRGDVGKNLLIDLILRYCYKNANDYQSMKIKYRMVDYLSLVYGTTFAFVPWVINSDRNYIGPEMHLLRIWDCFPQPGKDSPDASDWFGVYALAQLSKLEKLKGLYNFDELKEAVKGAGGESRDTLRRSAIETERYTADSPKDAVFPSADLYTEYRSDIWITVSLKHNKLVRAIPNPYGNAKLPIVAKTAFPLQDTMYGLGEFERGQKLQKAINSLHNLYLDSVKYSIFPPVKISSTGVRRSTIKWGFGEQWEMDDPSKVMPLELSPLGLNVYQSTYGVLSSALANQSGTTNVQIPGEVSRSLGETATGVRFVSQRQNARDNWDQIMMEDFITKVTCRWQELIVNKTERPYFVEMFKEDIEAIQKRFPDVAEVFGDKQMATIGKDLIAPEKKKDGIYFDYDVEEGSTMKPNTEQDLNNLNQLLSIVTKSPQIVEQLAQRGKRVDIAELLMRVTEMSGVRDAERVITDIPPEEMAAMQQQQMGQMGGQMGQTQQPQFNDPEIQRAAMEAQSVLGGVNGIPTGNY